MNHARKLETEAEARARIPADSRLVCILGPSGIGKSTLLHLLEDANYAVIRSHTSRAMRESEREQGSDYEHISFHQMIKAYKAGHFSQISQNYGRSDAVEFDETTVSLGSSGKPRIAYTKPKGAGDLYGVTWSELADKLSAGQAFMAVTYDGVLQYEKLLPGQVIFIVLLPQHFEMLEQRLQGRGDDPETVKKRLAKAREECGYWRYAHTSFIITHNAPPEAIADAILNFTERKLVDKLLIPDWLGSLRDVVQRSLRNAIGSRSYLSRSWLLRKLVGGKWIHYRNVYPNIGGPEDWYYPIQRELEAVGLRVRLAGTDAEFVREGYI